MNIVQVTCGIILKDDKVLVAQRSETMSLPLKWEFPGGKLMQGESEEECLKRELHEELNIFVAVKSRLNASTYNYGNFTISLIPFIVDYMEGEIILHEHRQMGWFAKHELTALDWAPADVPVLEEFLIMQSPL
jgi:8-oxo-dGTP diphosphatase